jgi:hypothetical protein
MTATTILNTHWSGRHLHAAAPVAAGQMGLCLMSDAPVVMRQVAPAGVYSGVLSVAKDIMAKEGLKGFYRGLVPVIVRAVLSFSPLPPLSFLFLRPLASCVPLPRVSPCLVCPLTSCVLLPRVHPVHPMLMG